MRELIARHLLICATLLRVSWSTAGTIQRLRGEENEMSKTTHSKEPKVEVDDHVHEYILSHVSPEVEKKHRAKSKERAVKLHGISPEVAESLYGDTK